jgi:hypothetical protein
MFLPSHMPCAECGESVDRSAALSHSCEPQRRLAYQMLARHHEIASFEAELRVFLASTKGQFEAWLAARDVRRTA